MNTIMLVLGVAMFLLVVAILWSKDGRFDEIYEYVGVGFFAVSVVVLLVSSGYGADIDNYDDPVVDVGVVNGTGTDGGELPISQAEGFWSWFILMWVGIFTFIIGDSWMS